MTKDRGAAPVDEDGLRLAGEVALAVAHDVNNLLGAVQLRLQLLAGTAATAAGPETAGQLAAVSELVRAACERVGRLQALARAGLRRPAEVTLADSLREALALVESGLRLRARQGGVQIRIACDLPDLPPVRGVPDDIQRLLVRLLCTARDALPRGGLIRLAGQQADGRVVLRVEAVPTAQRRGAPLPSSFELAFPVARPRPSKAAPRRAQPASNAGPRPPKRARPAKPEDRGRLRA